MKDQKINNIYQTILNKLDLLGWSIVTENNQCKQIEIDSKATKRMEKAPKEFISFISFYSLLSNKENTTWFLSYKDYYTCNKTVFTWDEYEKQSLEYSDECDIKYIEEYWDNHIPFIMSVQSEYSYVAIGVGSDNYGNIFHGIEPDYEDSTCIANNLNEYLSNVNTYNIDSYEKNRDKI